MSPQQNITAHMRATIYNLNFRLSGLKSKTAVNKLSRVEFIEPNPNKIIIKKNIIDQICPLGNLATAWGYIMKASPAPFEVTFSIGIPNS